jgi:hypothetical protein
MQTFVWFHRWSLVKVQPHKIYSLALKDTIGSGSFPLLNRVARPKTGENLIFVSLLKHMIPTISMEDNKKYGDMKEDINSHKLLHSILE